MLRPETDPRADRDIRQAYALISRLRGTSPEESVAALHDHAVLTGVSVHTAALAVLAEWHPAGGPRRRIPGAHSYTTADRTGRLVVRWQGREKANLSIRGSCSDDLVARLRRAVERTLRGGATHLVIDMRGTTGADVRFDDPTVSRRHALIVRQPDGVRVLDDRSLNGVFVNGERVEWRALKDGDEIVVGRYRLQYLHLTAEALAAAPQPLENAG